MKNFTNKVKAAAISAVVLASCTAVFPSASIEQSKSVKAAEVEKNYAKALQYSMYFYDANMCGTEVGETSEYVWRDDCHVYDAKLPLDSENTNMTDSFIKANKDILDPDGDGCLDVAGGFHDAGDHVKFGMPEGYSGAAIGWGYYEFKDSYKATGQDAHAETILRYFNDYFMKCTYLDENGKAIAFCYQVGDGDIDHAYWNAPEVDEMFRRGWFATDEMVSTDCLSITAASLALNYLNFKESDPDYAAENLKYAKALFEFADRAPDKAVNNDGPKGYYGSNKWEDDYCFAAALLYLATQEENYIDIALQTVDYYAPSCWTFCWNDTWAGAVCAIAEADDLYGKKITNSVGKESTEFIEKFVKFQDKSPYEDIDWWSQIAKLVDNWMNGSTPSITPAGYSFLNQWGSARYNTSAQFLALVYDKHHGDTASKYGDWAKSQMDYLLGENPINRCYIVGYSDISAKYPHHRAASGFSKCEDTGEQRYVLYGALVGGPGSSDEHIDITSDYIYNEVTIDYNAAFVGACAGQYHFFGDSSMQVTPDFPPEPSNPGEDPDNPGELTPTSKYWVEAFCVDIAQSDGPKATEVTFYVCSNVAKTSKNISVRYYFDATGMSSIEENDIELRILYDQAFTESQHAGTLSAPKKYKDNIYYVEVSWDDFNIANSNKKFQFALGTYAWGNSWNPSDDWSHQELKQEEDAFKGTVEKTQYICVYDDGVLVGGIEPDGSEPVSAVTTTPSVTTTPKPVTTTPKPVTTIPPVTTTPNPVTTKPITTESDFGPVGGGSSIMYGDINADKTVDLTDLTTLSLALLKDITFNDYQNMAADVNGDGQVTLADLPTLKVYLTNPPAGMTLGPKV